MSNNMPFNRPYMTGKELLYIGEAHFNGCLSGDDPFTKRCHTWVEQHTSIANPFLYSCLGNDGSVIGYPVRR